MRKLLLIGWSIACLLVPVKAAPTRSTKARAKPKPAPAKPFTLERLIVRLQDVANKEYTEAALLKKVDKDGIAFVGSAQNLARLKEAGASPAMLEVIRRLAPAPAALPPPVPKPEPTGAVEVTCAPEECLVSFGEKPAIATAGGKLVKQGLAPGSISVRVSKDGFIPWTGSVRVIATEKIAIAAALKPNLQTRQLWGTQLKNKMIRALGGEAGFKEARSLLAFGDATIWGHDGRKYTSSLEMLLRAPDKAFFRTRAGKRNTFEVEFLPTFQSKSNLQEEEARDTETGLRLLLKYQIPTLLDQLTLPGVQLLAETNDVQDGTELFCKSSTGELAILVDGDARPKEAREERPPGQGIRAHYSAYKLRDREYIPSEVSIVWPGPPKQGISVQFRSFELNPDPKFDKNYRLKRSSLKK